VCINIPITLVIGKNKNNIWFLGRCEEEAEKNEGGEAEEFHLFINMFYVQLIQLIPLNSQ
jgi:hypothetical protein